MGMGLGVRSACIRKPRSIDDPHFIGGFGRPDRALNVAKIPRNRREGRNPRSPLSRHPGSRKSIQHMGYLLETLLRARSKATSLGWGDGRLEGDMGLSPMASRHPTRAPTQRTSSTKSPISRMGLLDVAGGSRGFAGQVGRTDPDAAKRIRRIRRLGAEELLLGVFERADAITALARQRDLALAVVPPGCKRTPDP